MPEILPPAQSIDDLELVCPHDILFVGLTGSHSYGLNHSDSDYDYRGVYVLPLEEDVSLFRTNQTSFNQTEPYDIANYELAKFLQLVLRNNPNILEMLFLDEYLYKTEDNLLSNYLNNIFEHKQSVLSQHVRTTYIGYASSQFKKLQQRKEEGLEGYRSKLRKRFIKHSVHLFRLIKQGEEILTTGDLVVKLSDPQEIKDKAKLPYEEMVKLATNEIQKLKEIKSDLPEDPDFKLFDDMYRDFMSQRFKALEIETQKEAVTSPQKRTSRKRILRNPPIIIK